MPQMPPIRRRRSEMLNLNLGLYLDRPLASIPDRAMSSCRNVRVKEGKVRNDNMGWTLFAATGDPTWTATDILLCDQFVDRSGASRFIIGTASDLFRWDTGTTSIRYLTPIEDTGTLSVTPLNTTVTGVGTTFTDLKAGDWLHVGDAAFRERGATPSLDWVKIASITSDTILELESGWPAPALFAQDFTARKTLTGSVSTPYSYDVFPDVAATNEDIWYATNGSEVVKWDGTDAEITIVTGLGFTCEVLKYSGNMMLYGNLTESGESKPTSVRNSALGDPENVTTLEAGEFTIADGVDFLRSIRNIGGFVVAYCENSINTFEFVGAPLNFLVRTAVPNFGTVSGRSIVDRGNFHELLSRDRAYRFDGVSILEFAPHVFREVLRTLDPNRKSRAMTIYDEENGEIQWVIPLTGDGEGADAAPTTAYTEHYAENVGRSPVPMTVRDLPATASGRFLDSGAKTFADIPGNFDTQDFRFNDRFFSEAFPLTMFGDADGNVWTLGTSSTQNGAAIDSWARFARRSVVDGTRKGIVHRIEPYTEERPAAEYGLGVILWSTDNADGELTKASQLSADLTHTSSRWVSPRKSGLAFEVEFATNGVAHVFAVSGFAVTTTAAGER